MVLVQQKNNHCRSGRIIACRKFRFKRNSYSGILVNRIFRKNRKELNKEQESKFSNQVLIKPIAKNALQKN
jgi:hypothetical protein